MFKTIQLLLMGFLFYSYAMFQGGVVSYTLFYAVCGLLGYLFVMMLYPIHQIKATLTVDDTEIEAGEGTVVTVKLKRPLPMPFMFVTVGLSLPDTMRSTFTNINAFLDPVWPSRTLNTARTVLVSFKRETVLTYTLNHLPRGKHVLEGVDVTIEDIFLFTKKATQIKVNQAIYSYPILIPTDKKNLTWTFQAVTKKLHPYHKLREDMAGVREYVSGDKMSQIDWKKSSKQATLFTKQFDPKPEEKMMFFLDTHNVTHENEWAVTVLYSLMRLFDTHKRAYYVNLSPFHEQSLDPSLSHKQKQQKLARLDVSHYDLTAVMFNKGITPIVISSRKADALPEAFMYQLKKQNGLLILTSTTDRPKVSVTTTHLTPSMVLGGELHES
ncbi:hypothetical protein HHA03_14530 [Halolactibacillus halophilus]|uniref:DUF58 domain-containing protein n=1 Tax=Halolactibacillus halophilus TaxID=306540 RepID=A0ABQ0VLE4_9BACI|nr:hypothetical protein HHA03_14530 [Halolactibacillus halophilus]